MSERDDSKKPWVSNYPPLLEWLTKHKGLCMWQNYGDRISTECWSVGQALAIVLIYADGAGWDIFTPCLDTNIEATLADAEKRLGLA